MSEKLVQTGEKENLIKAEAFFDAAEYVRLMREKSPDSLVLDSGGDIIINVSDGEEIIARAKEKLGLNQEEIVLYLHTLGERVREILRS